MTKFGKLCAAVVNSKAATKERENGYFKKNISLYLSSLEPEMPRKTGCIKTYGRHKFRTVKTAPWVSPDDVFRSPASKKEKSFETPTTIRKTLTCTNLPKSSWNIPKHKTGPIHDKENVLPSNEENIEWKISSNINNSVTAHITDKKTCSTKSSTNAMSVSSQDSFETEESYVPVQQKIKQLGNNLRSVIPETPEWAMDAKTKLHDESSIIIFNSYKQWTTSSDNISHNSSIKSTDKSNISKIDSRWSLLSSGSDISIEVPLKISLGFDCKEKQADDNDISFSTSTPVMRANSENSKFVTLTGQNKQNVCSTKIHNISVSDCQVLVNPIKLTPEQYQAARFSVSNNISESSTQKGNALTFYSVKEYQKPSLLHKPKSLDGSNFSVDKEKENEKESTVFSSRGSTGSDGIVRDCVVALEKLRLSPLIGNQKRKRLSTSGISGRSKCAGSLAGETWIPLSPRKQATHMSFVEALTPMKVTGNPAARELTAFKKLLMECEQDTVMTFHEYLSQSSLKKCVKIGEGVYGEVYKTINNSNQKVALKIIPINGDFEVNGELQKSSEEILPEIIISKELNALKYSAEINENSTPNFIDVNRVSLVQDKYPAHLIREWIKWDKENQSENDKPDVFSCEQCFLVFEFANGGQDLENFEFNSYSEALSVLQQITLSLAVAESSLEFEHRDLHWGNILIIQNDQEEIVYSLNGEAIMINSYGVHVSIIDFTLSRLTKDGVTVFCNLSEDESLFTGKGDYQFEIYRQMRRINEDDWEMFCPATNVQWLHYIADKLIRNKKYSSRDRKRQAKLQMFFSQVKNCQSAKEVVYSDFFNEI